MNFIKSSNGNQQHYYKRESYYNYSNVSDCSEMSLKITFIFR